MSNVVCWFQNKANFSFPYFFQLRACSSGHREYVHKPLFFWFTLISCRTAILLHALCFTDIKQVHYAILESVSMNVLLPEGSLGGDVPAIVLCEFDTGRSLGPPNTRVVINRLLVNVIKLTKPAVATVACRARRLRTMTSTTSTICFLYANFETETNSPLTERFSRGWFGPRQPGLIKTAGYARPYYYYNYYYYIAWPKRLYPVVSWRRALALVSNETSRRDPLTAGFGPG